MQPRHLGPALLALLVLGASPPVLASAGVAASGDIGKAPGCNGASKLDQGLAQAAASLDACSASASASIDLPQGVLRSTSSSGLADGPLAGSVVTIEDRLTFSGGASPAQLDWSIDGFISQLGASNGSRNTYAQLTINLFPALGASSSFQLRFGTPEFCHNVGQPCVAGSSFASSGAIAVPTDAGPVTVLITLGTGANGGWTSNFGNTARLALALPPDVTVTSDTGAFLVAASPVPEAPSAALALLGLAGLAWRRRRN